MNLCFLNGEIKKLVREPQRMDGIPIKKVVLSTEAQRNGEIYAIRK